MLTGLSDAHLGNGRHAGRGIGPETETGVLQKGPTMVVQQSIRMPISSDADIVTARVRGRAMAEHAGFKGADVSVVAAVISEVARCIRASVGTGEITLAIGQETGKAGIIISVRSCPQRALEELLPEHRLRRSMDEFRVRFEAQETTLTMKRWLNVWAQ